MGASLLAGCEGAEPSGAQTKILGAGAAAGKRAAVSVGLVTKTLLNPFFVEVERGARRAEHDLGLRLKVRTGAQETSVEQQIQIVEDLIRDKVAAIVIAPSDSQRLVGVLKNAHDMGIVVVNIDNRLDPEAVHAAGWTPPPFISVDNEAGAFKAAQFLARSVSGPSQAGILDGIRSADNAKQRVLGARCGFAQNPQVRVVASRSANWELDQAHAVTREMLQQHPRLSLLFASNDVMAIGAIRFLRETGRTHVRVAGYDALPEAIDAIRAGALVATVDQQAAEQGYQGVVQAYRLLQGQPVPPLTLIETRLVTAQTLVDPVRETQGLGTRL
ncbi:MAG: sugar ABC transporter substrate-binding protein [Rhodoferax sp.]